MSLLIFEKVVNIIDIIIFKKKTEKKANRAIDVTPHSDSAAYI